MEKERTVTKSIKSSDSSKKTLSTKELNKLKAEAKKFVTNNLPADK